MKKVLFLFFAILFLSASRTSFADPSVLSGNPVNGTTSVAVNTRLTIMFDDNITSASIGSSTGSTGTFTVTYQDIGTQYVVGNIEVIDVGSRTVARFTPTSNLSNSTQYSYTMATGTVNLYGTTSSGFAGTFTTGTNQDTVNAGVWYTSPYSNSTNVAINTQYIYVILNERIDASTAKDPVFTFTANSQSVSGYWAYYDYGDNYVGTPTAIFTPNGNLAYSTAYTISVGTNMLDMCGQQLSQQYTSTFTTASAPVADSYTPPKEKLEITNCYPKNDNAYTGTKAYARFCMLVNSDDINMVDGVDVASSGGREDEKFFVLKDSWNNRVSGRTKGHGRDIIFTPDSRLTIGEKYTATVKTTVRAANAAGTQMENDYSWTFTVSADGGTGSSDPSD